MSWLWIPFINVALGLWLIVAAFVFNVQANAVLPSIVLGILTLAVAFVSWTGTYLLRSPSWSWLSWIDVALGLGAVAMPFVYGLPSAPLTSYVITGLVIAIVAFVNWLYTYVVRPERLF